MNPLEQRKRIVDAARALLAEQRQLDRLKLEAVAQRAELSLDMVRFHFPDRKNLAEFMLDEYIHDMMERMRAAAMAETETEPWLRAYWKNYVEIVSRHPEAMHPALMQDPVLRDFYVELTEGGLRNVLSEGLVFMMKRGTLPTLPEPLLTGFMYGMTVETGRNITRGRLEPDAKLVEQLVAFSLNGLRAAAGV